MAIEMSVKLSNKVGMLELVRERCRFPIARVQGESMDGQSAAISKLHRLVYRCFTSCGPAFSVAFTHPLAFFGGMGGHKQWQ